MTETPTSEKLTQGAHHIGLSVYNLDEAKSFFQEALGYDVVGKVPDYPAIFISDGITMLTLWQVADPETATGFDRRANIGLHHLALRVANETALQSVHERVKAHPGTAIEFAPESISEGSSVKHFICAMPGGIRIEFATPFS
tara:strand:- start:2290 stop:2715 length:426 start_codon:yes stop_codon:yes gene_type:complete